MKTLEVISTYDYDFEIRFNYKLQSNPNDYNSFNNELDNFETDHIWNEDIIKDILIKNIFFIDEVYSIIPDISSGDSYYDFENEKIIIALPVRISFKDIFTSSDTDISSYLDRKKLFSTNEDIIVKDFNLSQYNYSEEDYLSFV